MPVAYVSVREIAVFVSGDATGHIPPSNSSRQIIQFKLSVSVDLLNQLSCVFYERNQETII